MDRKRETQRMSDQLAEQIREIERLKAEKIELTRRLAAAEARAERLSVYEPRVTADSTLTDTKVLMHKEIMQRFVEAFDAAVGDANYTETAAVMTGELNQGIERRYTITVQKEGRPTPHEKRKEAEADRDYWKARAEAAEAVVAKLPKTADGVPITPGMWVWSATTSPADGSPGDPFLIGREIGGGDAWEVSNLEYRVGPLYSTREAAEAARNAKEAEGD